MAELKKKSYVGEVVSDKMDKTVIVTISRRIKHPLYNKTISKVSRFKAHDEKNECATGDKVRMIETRPLSKGKRFEIVEIIEKAR
jgi:small subunit ribosomal protein S17